MIWTEFGDFDEMGEAVLCQLADDDACRNAAHRVRRQRAASPLLNQSAGTGQRRRNG